MTGGTQPAVGASALRVLRRGAGTLWRHLPVQLRRSAIHGAIDLLEPGLSHVSRDVVLDREVPRIVVGLLSSASGLGQSARLAAAALRRCGYRVLGIDVSPFFYDPGGMVAHDLPDGRSCRGPGHAVVVVNAPFMPYALTLAGRGFLRDKWVTGYWAWELPRLPPSWHKGFASVHDVAVPSRFVADAVESAGLSQCVRVAPHPVACDPPPLSPVAQGAARGAAWPPGAFTVATVANLASSFTRKNPLALIEAYRLAFGRDRGARLRMHLTGAASAARAAIEAAIDGNDGIEVEWRASSRADLYAWWGAADVYAALHRSEGFGLPIAEAMLAGHAAVATGWSGNMQFMSADTAFPVDWRPVPVIDPEAKYEAPDTCWAEPDIEHAAALLQRLRRNPDLVREMGCRAHASASAQLTAEAFVAGLMGDGCSDLEHSARSWPEADAGR